jgi:hypothetical protein
MSPFQPPVSVPRDNIQRCLAINLNLVLSKESTVAKNACTTVNKTMIPVWRWAIKSNGKTSPFPLCLLRMPGDTPESRFVQRVNSHKGCWYQSQQDHTPSLMLSNQIKWQGVTLSTPCVCSPQWYSKMPGDKPESCFVQRVNSREGCWYHSRQDHNPSSTLSNQIKFSDIMEDVRSGKTTRHMAECGIWWEQKLVNLYVSVDMNKNTFHIDSYVIDRIRTCLHWSALYEG